MAELLLGHCLVVLLSRQLWVVLLHPEKRHRNLPLPKGIQVPLSVLPQLHL